MAEPNRPGPGRSTAEAAFSAVKKEVALRNEQTHKAAQKLRAARQKKEVARRRELDRL